MDLVDLWVHCFRSTQIHSIWTLGWARPHRLCLEICRTRHAVLGSGWQLWSTVVSQGQHLNGVIKDRRRWQYNRRPVDGEDPVSVTLLPVTVSTYVHPELE